MQITSKSIGSHIFYSRNKFSRPSKRGFLTSRINAPRGSYPGVVDVIRGGGNEGQEDSVDASESQQQS